MSRDRNNTLGRQELEKWLAELDKNCYLSNPDFRHSVAFHLPSQFYHLDKQLEKFAHSVVHEIEPLVRENNLPHNLPQIAHYDAIGRGDETVIHHPAYEASGNLIYKSGLMERFATPGKMLEGLTFLFLSSHVGEAGHNCPIACSAGLIRILQRVDDFAGKSAYLQKLTAPSYTENYTGAQFVTEIQGGSDVGANAVEAVKDEKGHWRITGEKWFCSNANADLILLTARWNRSLPGTKGLGLFLVPARVESGERNYYFLRRLKDKLGTRSMATAEIDFDGAYAIAMGSPEEGIKLLMEHVLHLSRIFNTFCVLGMARRAYQISLAYAKHRAAFDRPIISYALVQENLARMKAENTALVASIFAAVKLQDDFDVGQERGDKTKLLLRLLANINKYLSALWSVEHIHHALDILAGNGTIETFSIIPLLLRDCIICENWEGTHNILRMQILKDILRYDIDRIFLDHMHALLDKVPEGTNKKLLVEYQEDLKSRLKTLRSSAPEIQAFQIKDVVDRMGILFLASQLLMEAIDQEKQSDASKMHCLNYFLYLHVQKGYVDYDQLHLSLIRACLGS